VVLDGFIRTSPRVRSLNFRLPTIHSEMQRAFPTTPFSVNFSCGLRLTAGAGVSMHAKNLVCAAE
jgi:hypothetical protein